MSESRLLAGADQDLNRIDLTREEQVNELYRMRVLLHYAWCRSEEFAGWVRGLGQREAQALREISDDLRSVFLCEDGSRVTAVSLRQQQQAVYTQTNKLDQAFEAWGAYAGYVPVHADFVDLKKRFDRDAKKLLNVLEELKVYQRQYVTVLEDIRQRRQGFIKSYCLIWEILSSLNDDQSSLIDDTISHAADEEQMFDAFDNLIKDITKLCEMQLHAEDMSHAYYFEIAFHKLMFDIMDDEKKDHVYSALLRILLSEVKFQGKVAANLKALSLFHEKFLSYLATKNDEMDNALPNSSIVEGEVPSSSQSHEAFCQLAKQKQRDKYERAQSLEKVRLFSKGIVIEQQYKMAMLLAVKNKHRDAILCLLPVVENFHSASCYKLGIWIREGRGCRPHAMLGLYFMMLAYSLERDGDKRRAILLDCIRHKDAQSAGDIPGEVVDDPVWRCAEKRMLGEKELVSHFHALQVDVCQRLFRLGELLVSLNIADDESGLNYDHIELSCYFFDCSYRYIDAACQRAAILNRHGEACFRERQQLCEQIVDLLDVLVGKLLKSNQNGDRQDALMRVKQLYADIKSLSKVNLSDQQSQAAMTTFLRL